jgi:hypothetical protein
MQEEKFKYLTIFYDAAYQMRILFSKDPDYLYAHMVLSWQNIANDHFMTKINNILTSVLQTFWFGRDHLIHRKW